METKTGNDSWARGLHPAPKWNRGFEVRQTSAGIITAILTRCYWGHITAILTLCCWGHIASLGLDLFSVKTMIASLRNAIM